MEPAYFAGALSDLSDTLKPYIAEGITGDLDRLVFKLQIEYPQLAIQRYAVQSKFQYPLLVRAWGDLTLLDLDINQNIHESVF